ncbi:P-loop containing nucleoside triphosphate hydrolase protein [Lophiotrema nucula]|uniref:P-loop containing nucleoside triphosphate hydrolase protein n=1 Tax=Lophiotrema nucula TaxID=690887 RepID=A0A6A5YGX4_9PLEO|nr:P-loop containing nucleoside triphosphate hydrolase protein [Lophiotrema nucula]
MAEIRLFCSDDPQYGIEDVTLSHESQEDEDVGKRSVASSTEITDTLAGLDEPTADDNGEGEICELHVYETRFNSKGEPVVLQVGTMDQLALEPKRSPDAALILIRHYNIARSLERTTLEIRSPYMRTALRKVIKSYPDVSFDSTSNFVIPGPPRCLFHYRHELLAFAQASKNENIEEHVDFLLRYMARALRKEISSYDLLLDGNANGPGLEYDHLWMAFRPGDLLYEKIDGEDRICRLRSMSPVRYHLDGQYYREYWSLFAEIIQCDGDNFGYTRTYATIEKYDGYRPLRNLDIFPLIYHEEVDRIRSDVVARGKVYLSLLGVHYCFYDGVAELLKEQMQAHGRVIVDCREWNLNIAPGMSDFIAGAEVIDCARNEHRNLVEDDLLLCSHKVPGFFLVTKRWCYFKVRCIAPIQFSSAAFDNLVIPLHQKELIGSVVKELQGKPSGFDDFIKGKGKGLIFLLHGEPGVGKTLTAESIAELTQRPLYTLGCGDLGTQSHNVELELTRTLALASKWNALVLVDEADVFMEQRNSRDLNRNELVSVLLRVLEYFEGIMFLTTNRIESIDTAFKSRIHLSLYYPKLSASARRSIWRVFIANDQQKDPPSWLNDRFLRRVAAYDVNGRQIKNIMRMACSIAANNQRELSPKDIMSGLDAHRTFETDFKSPETRRVGLGGQTLTSFLISLVILVICSWVSSKFQSEASGLAGTCE